MTLAHWFRHQAAAHRILRVLLLAAFAWLAGRHWHPYYGFTRFLQMDTASAAATVAELRTAPLFLYDDGYDGHYYAQLAARPAVNDPVLAGSIDNVGYRARRILLSWIAWAAGGGDPVSAVRAYAALNLFLWTALAVLLWEIFPCTGWRETLAWGGTLFSAGVLHSVRLALTDLLALLLVAGAVVSLGRNRRGLGVAILAIGGLARETVMLAAVTLLPAEKRRAKIWVRTAADLALVAAPLTVWVLYLRLGAGWGGGEPANFTFPLAGWVGKWSEAWQRLRGEPDHWLALTSLLAQVALTVQAAYVLLRRDLQNPWWRLGIVYVGLMVLLGPAVWQGHPGAVTRVLLPLTLAFNVLAVAGRARAPWLVAGNLSVLAGVLALWTVPLARNELSAGRLTGGAYVVHTDERWHTAEHTKGRTWAWAADIGGLRVDLQPSGDRPRRLRLAVKAINARPLEILQGGRIIWRGPVAEKIQEIDLPAVAVVRGRIELELRSPAAPVQEGPGSTGRALGFAVYGVRVD